MCGAKMVSPTAIFQAHEESYQGDAGSDKYEENKGNDTCNFRNIITVLCTVNPLLILEGVDRFIVNEL